MRRFFSAVRRRPRASFAIVVGCALVLAVSYAAAVVTPQVGEPFDPKTITPDKSLWTFGFVGDTQQADDKLEPLMAALAKHNVEFVLHLGDMVDEATSDLEWDRLLEIGRAHV